MNKLALLHRAKSEYAYAYDKETVHITLRTAKNDLTSVKLVYGDPFDWVSDVDQFGWNYHIEPMSKRYQTEMFDYYFISIKPSDLRVKYAFILNDEYIYGSKSITGTKKVKENFDLQNFFNFPYLNIEDLHHTPDWVKDTVWYQIFPDRFYTEKPNLKWGKLPVTNDEIYGGDLKGITAKLDYLHSFGITGIYFTPIFEAKTAHKYDTIDYYKIDPSFGTNEDFKKLVNKAHSLGIKVMLDGVFNHSGFLHPYFLDVVEKGEESIYANSFHIDEFPVVNFPLDENGEPAKHTTKKLNFKTFAYTPHMPKWNTSDKLTEDHLLGVIKYWIEEYNIDGWRLDVSNEISHDFLRKIKEASREANPDTFILGENWDASLPWLLGDQMDSVMNYDLTVPMWNYFEHNINTNEFINQINHYLAHTPKNVMANMFNLIDSHDTVRILRRLNDNKDRTKLAYLFMFLSKGAPNIYYGGEVAMTGDHDPDNRRCMLWNENEQDLEFFDFIKTLIILRNEHKEFSESDYNFIESNVLMFTKGDLLVLINNSENEVTTTLNDNLINTYTNLFTNKKDKYDKITLEAYKFIVLKRV